MNASLTPIMIGFSCRFTTLGIRFPAFSMSRQLASATFAPVGFRKRAEVSGLHRQAREDVAHRRVELCWFAIPSLDQLGSARFSAFSSAWFCQKQTRTRRQRRPQTIRRGGARQGDR